MPEVQWVQLFTNITSLTCSGSLRWGCLPLQRTGLCSPFGILTFRSRFVFFLALLKLHSLVRMTQSSRKMFILLFLRDFRNPKEKTFSLCANVVDEYIQLRHELEDNKSVRKEQTAKRPVLLFMFWHCAGSPGRPHCTFLPQETVVWMHEVHPLTQPNLLSMHQEQICWSKYCII